MPPPELGGGLDPWGLGPFGLLYIEALAHPHAGTRLTSGIGAFRNWPRPRDG